MTADTFVPFNADLISPEWIPDILTRPAGIGHWWGELLAAAVSFVEEWFPQLLNDLVPLGSSWRSKLPTLGPGRDTDTVPAGIAAAILAAAGVPLTATGSQPSLEGWLESGAKAGNRNLSTIGDLAAVLRRADIGTEAHRAAELLAAGDTIPRQRYHAITEALAGSPALRGMTGETICALDYVWVSRRFPYGSRNAAMKPLDPAFPVALQAQVTHPTQSAVPMFVNPDATFGDVAADMARLTGKPITDLLLHPTLDAAWGLIGPFTQVISPDPQPVRPHIGLAAATSSDLTQPLRQRVSAGWSVVGLEPVNGELNRAACVWRLFAPKALADSNEIEEDRTLAQLHPDARFVGAAAWVSGDLLDPTPVSYDGISTLN